MNRDGKPDVVTATNYGTTVTSYATILLGNGDGTFGAAQDFAVAPGASSVAVADLDSDGIPDIVVGNNASDTMTVLTTSVPIAHRGYVPGDLNGDGTPDLVWQNRASGESTVWYMTGTQGTTFASSNLLSGSTNPGPSWTLVGSADFNLDGHPDLIWQHQSTRQVMVWYMGGAQGNTYLSSNSLTTTNRLGWTLICAADVNGDGHPDLIWQNDSTRQVTVWYMGGAQGNNYQSAAWLSKSNMTGWSLVGAADFNADGHPDLVWQNDSTWQVMVWYMGGAQGTTYQSKSWLSSKGVPSWTVAGIADVNSDGYLDLIMQNVSTQQVVVWYFGGRQGSTYKSQAWMDKAGKTGWTVIARFN